ncbi:glycosyltransferase family 2 protein [Aestuariivivens sediminis]|uniref:glycosyltransferase family 2 protein n=1 Tax=Aestuariivivens sediminis TaxID=2913557 RepID=UPI001F55E48D
MNELVYIVIVAYNGTSWLRRCLESCGDYPVVVVDNASTDGTVSLIEKGYPKVSLIKQTENLGFGQANNIGIRYALNQGAESVFLLNQDAYLEDNALERLVAFQKVNSNYWIVSPLHITPDKKRLDKQFSYYMTYDKSPTFYSDFVLSNTIQEVYDVPFVNAAAWLLSRTCLQMVGGFDPIFFHYGEDENYCQRVLFHGGHIGVLPQAKVIHDREDRPPKPMKPFSRVYYEHKLKNFKIQQANVNTFDVSLLNKKISAYNKQMVKSLCMGRFKHLKGLKQEQQLFMKAKRDILKSVERNRQTGATYLNYNKESK